MSRSAIAYACHIGTWAMVVVLLIGTSVAAESPRRGVISAHDAAGFHLLSERGVDAHGHQRLAIDRQALAVIREAEDESIIRMPISPDEEVQLVMERFRAITADARFVRVNEQGEEIEMDVPDVLLLRGSIAGEPGSRAFLAITERGGGTGTITFTGGREIRIETDRDEQDDVQGLIVRPGGAEWPDVEELCRVLDSPDAHAHRGCCPTAEANEPDLYRGPRLLTIAVEGDQEYTELFPTLDDAAAYVVQVIGAVSDIYIRDLDFRVMVDEMRLWPDGDMPFGAHSLSGFRNWWLENNSMQGLNLVHLFSGRRDVGYGGVAYIANACSQWAFGISAFLLGDFPDPLQSPHLGNWDVVVIAHEIGHNLGTLHTHDYGIDACASGENVRGTIMSYCHINQGGLLNTDLRMHAEIAEIILDNNPHDDDFCLFYDCNGNGIDDAVDIALGKSEDVDGNGIPDECEDCTGTGILHSQLIEMGAPDINKNGIPDFCEPDCTGTGIPDSYEIEQGCVEDVNGNNIPDICMPDCDGNGVPDFLDILEGTHTDYDRNTVPDVCQDCLGNGVPDWIDLERQFHLFIGMFDGAVREYHRDSGVYMQTLGADQISQTFDVVFGEDRLLYVASYATDEIIQIDPDTGEAVPFVAAGEGGLSQPTSLTFGPSGNLFVAAGGTNSVLEYEYPAGTFVGVLVPSGSGSLENPRSIRFGPCGNLFVSSFNNNRVLEYDGETGAFLGIFADQATGNINGPRGLAFLPNGDLLAVNTSNPSVERFASDGTHLGQFNDHYPITSPWGITIGPNGNVFLPSMVSPVRVIEYDADTGLYIRSFVRGDSGLYGPTSLAFRPASSLDQSGTGIPDVCEKPQCPGDFNADGVVNVADMITLISAWGPCDDPEDCPADLTGDGAVGVDDLLVLIGLWGPCPNGG